MSSITTTLSVGVNTETTINRTYWENGKPKMVETYKDGKLDGLWESYHENGQLVVRGTYIDGNKVGLWEEYH